MNKLFPIAFPPALPLAMFPVALTLSLLLPFAPFSLSFRYFFSVVLPFNALPLFPLPVGPPSSFLLFPSLLLPFFLLFRYEYFFSVLLLFPLSCYSFLLLPPGL